MRGERREWRSRGAVKKSQAGKKANRWQWDELGVNQCYGGKSSKDGKVGVGMLGCCRAEEKMKDIGVWGGNYEGIECSHDQKR